MGEPLPAPKKTPMTRTCAVHKHRSAKPTEIHHVWPLGMGGPDTRANKAPLCSDGHSSVHNYMELLKKYDTAPNVPTEMPKVPWLQKIGYGKKVRELAILGYARYKRQSM